MKTETFTFRDPQVEAVRFPADESLQKQIEQHFNGQIKGTSLPPVERVCEFRDLAGSEITASVGDIITKSISGGIRVYDQNTFDAMFEKGYLGEQAPMRPSIGTVRDDLINVALKPMLDSGPLKPMHPHDARLLAIRAADIYRPSYWKDDFIPHTWVVAAILEASTAPHFLKK